MFFRKILLVCFIALACGMPLFAQQYAGNLNIVTASSSLTVSGDLNTIPFADQLPGSRIASYFGSVNVNIDLGPKTIQFTNLGTATANNFASNLQPLPGGGAGSAPANYGISVIAFALNGTLRNLSVSMVNAAPVSMSGVGPYSFNVNGGVQAINILTGNLDYRSGLGPAGTENLVGGTALNTSGTSATLLDLGAGLFQVTFPVSISFTGSTGGTPDLPYTLSFNGSITASGTLVAVPEPATVAMIGVSLGIAGYVTHRRRKATKKAMEAAI